MPALPIATDAKQHLRDDAFRVLLTGFGVSTLGPSFFGRTTSKSL